jgi:hypothetical protein
MGETAIHYRWSTKPIKKVLDTTRLEMVIWCGYLSATTEERGRPESNNQFQYLNSPHSLASAP